MTRFTLPALALVAASVAVSAAPLDTAGIPRAYNHVSARDLSQHDLQQLLDDCPGGPVGNADKCTFETLADGWTAPAPYNIWLFETSDVGNGCDTPPGSSYMSKVTQSTTTGHGFGVGAKFGYKAGLPIISEEASAKVSVGTTFQQTETTTNSVSKTLNVPGGKQQAMISQTSYKRTPGRMRVNYGKKVKLGDQGEHYIWYVYDQFYDSSDDGADPKQLEKPHDFDCNVSIPDQVAKWNAAGTNVLSGWN